MGGFQEWVHGFMMTLFPKCYYSQLPLNKRRFHLTVVDLMQWYAGMVISEKIHCTHFNTEAVIKRVEKAVAEQWNAGDDPEKPITEVALVGLLDTIHQVPRSKGATQKARDSQGTPHMTEARFNEMSALYPDFQPGDLFIGSLAHPERQFPLAGSEVWRSETLNLQMNRALCCRLVNSSKPAHSNRVFVLDDGLLMQEEEWRQFRLETLALHPEVTSAFEQECLVHSEAKRTKMRRCIVYSDGKHVEKMPTGTGEADIKILHYMRPSLGVTRILGVNQDSDVIFALVLQIERMLQEHAKLGDSAEPLEVWLDTHSPQCKESKPYRYIDMVALYYAICDLFEREYPRVRHPVETFCFLVFMKKTDFVELWCQDCPEKRGHKDCLCVGDADAWNLFSELHSSGKAAGGNGFITFTSKPNIAPLPRSSVRYWDSKLYGLLDNAVTYDWVSRQFFFQHEALKRFYYLLFQQRLMHIRQRLRLPIPSVTGSDDMFAPVYATVIDPQELLIYGHDVAERLEMYRAPQAKSEQILMGQKRAGEEGDGGPPLSEKKFKPSSLCHKKGGKLLAREGSIEMAVDGEDGDEEVDDDSVPRALPAIVKRFSSEQPMARYLRENADVLREFARFPMKKYHGLPTPESVRLRLYDLEFYMAYLRDAWWKGEAAATELTNRSVLDDSLQVWPYEARELEGAEWARSLNSTYYVTGPNQTRFEVRKSSHVIHRRYCEPQVWHV